MNTPATTAAPVPVNPPLPQSLRGKTVAILGGSSGIGLATAGLLRELGARVVLAARGRDRLTKRADELRRAWPGEAHDVLAVGVDDLSEAAVTSVFDAAGTVDHVVLTAGEFGWGTVLDNPREAVAELIDSRLWGAYNTGRVAGAKLPPGGSVTFFSGAMVARPRSGSAGIAAAAGAVETLSRGLAVELAPRRVRVNTVRSGSMDSPLARRARGGDADPDGPVADEAMRRFGATLPLGRLGDLTEAASAVVFLLGNNYVTGSLLTVDGGFSVSP